MRQLKLSLLATLALVMGLATSLGAVSAERETATNVFHGRATTGTGALPLPVEIRGLRQLPDGTFRVDYYYRAEGTATGDLAGTFVYNEHGYIIVRDPTDPQTMIANVLIHQEIVLDPSRPGPLVTIIDTDPTAYQFGSATVKLCKSWYIRATPG